MMRSASMTSSRSSTEFAELFTLTTTPQILLIVYMPSTRQKQTKRKNDSAAVRDGTADIAQTKRHATMQACTARNHDAAFLAATIGSVEGIQCETLADPFFAPAVSTREAVERELARRRVVRVHKVQARHEEAIRRGLIERTALACLGIDTEIARILELKIGATGLTLEELFRDHAVYFGFCSLSGHRLREEESAFVTDPRRKKPSVEDSSKSHIWLQ